MQKAALSPGKPRPPEFNGAIETCQTIYPNYYSLNTFFCGVSWLAAWSLGSRTEKSMVLEVIFLTILYIAYVAKKPPEYYKSSIFQNQAKPEK